MQELTEIEKQVLEVLRKLKNYGKIEISLNQDSSQLSIYLTNITKEIISIKKEWKIKGGNQENQEIEG